MSTAPSPSTRTGRRNTGRRERDRPRSTTSRTADVCDYNQDNNKRARGERAFYHFVDDRVLRRLCQGQIDEHEPVLHLAEALEQRPQRDSNGGFENEVGDILVELAELDRQRHQVLLRTKHDVGGAELAQAYADLGLPNSEPSEAQRVRCEVAQRDARAIARRFIRWFPTLENATEGRSDEGPSQGRDALLIVLGTIAEVLNGTGGDVTGRQADAIEILERLLPNAGLTPGDYFELIAANPVAVAPALAAVKAAATMNRSG